MIDRHKFEEIAKQFRKGLISLSDFTTAMFGNSRLNGGPSYLRVPERPEDSHKGDFGRVLLIGGSTEMPGAIALSALAALRAGSGLVTVATPRQARPVVASFSPCLMACGFEAQDGCFSVEAATEIVEKCDWADVVAIGPGMGTTPGCQQIVQNIYRELSKPVVLDADAINCLVAAEVDLASHAGRRVLTPHPGEFTRLAGRKFEQRETMERHAIEIARKSNVVLVLKGSKTLVTDGTQFYHNDTGNHGMATGGSGDVLTGIIASLIGQKMSAIESARSGCCLHGLAGDIFAEKSSAASLIATDLIEYLPAALDRLAGNSSSE